jgi:hypothetical protein
LVIVAIEDAVALDDCVVAIGLGSLMDARGVAQAIIAEHALVAGERSFNRGAEFGMVVIDSLALAIGGALDHFDARFHRGANGGIGHSGSGTNIKGSDEARLELRKESLLLELRQEAGDPAFAVGLRRRPWTGDVVGDADRQHPMGVVVIVNGDAELLEIVAA